MTYYDVAAVKCASYDENEIKNALEAVLSPIGGLDWVDVGMKIAIKANLVTFAKPEEAVTTHPILIRELIKMLKEKGAEVVVGDSPGGLYNAAFLNKVYSVCGLESVTAVGGILNRDFSLTEVKYPDAKVLRSFTYTAYLDSCDAIIDFCKLKTHGMMGMSAAAKNMFGVIPGTMKPEYHFRFPNHEDFARMIVDIDEYFSSKIKLCIADAIVGMEGNGPTAGTPREIGCLLASKSPHMLDMVCAKIIGLSESEIPTLQAARERGLIPDDINRMKIFGDTDSMVIPDYKNIAVKRSLLFDNKSKLFGKVARRALEAKPVVKKNLCKSCQKCKQICPAQAIKMVDNKPVIDRKKCIKCFCCQEFCPFAAMVVHRPVLAKILTK